MWMLAWWEPQISTARPIRCYAFGKKGMGHLPTVIDACQFETTHQIRDVVTPLPDQKNYSEKMSPRKI